MRNSPRSFLAGLLAAIALLQTTTFAQLINGSFEDGLNGWGYQSVKIDDPYFPSADGTSHVRLGGADIPKAYLYQAVPIRGGANCELSFAWAANGDAYLQATLRVVISTTKKRTLIVQDFTQYAPANPGDMTYQNNSVSFTTPTDCGDIAIGFFDMSPNDGIAIDPLLDNVDLKVSDPSPGLLIYNASSVTRYAGGHTNVTTRVQQYWIYDMPTGILKRISYGKNSHGQKLYTTSRLTQLRQHSPVGLRDASETILAEAFAPLDALGRVGYLTRVFRGPNALLLNGPNRSMIFFPRSFRGETESFHSGSVGQSAIWETTEAASYWQAGTLASNSLGESLDDATARLTAYLEAHGYVSADSKKISADKSTDTSTPELDWLD